MFLQVLLSNSNTYFQVIRIFASSLLVLPSAIYFLVYNAVRPKSFYPSFADVLGVADCSYSIFD